MVVDEIAFGDCFVASQTVTVNGIKRIEYRLRKWWPLRYITPDGEEIVEPSSIDYHQYWSMEEVEEAVALNLLRGYSVQLEESAA